MDFTNSGLVQHSQRALMEKWYYGWGAYGKKATKELIDSLIKQYPSNAIWRSYMMGAVGKTRLCDCYGLVKSYLWWQGDDKDPIYNPIQDRSSTTAYNASKEKGKIDAMPEIPGLVLYMPGHAGVYVGSGNFIEMMGDGKGASAGIIRNGAVSSGSKFTHWFKDSFITYSTPNVEQSTSTNIDIPSNWAKESWAWAKERQITDGTNPSGYCTREQVVQLLFNAFKYLDNR